MRTPQFPHRQNVLIAVLLLFPALGVRTTVAQAQTQDQGQDQTPPEPVASAAVTGFDPLAIDAPSVTFARLAASVRPGLADADSHPDSIRDEHRVEHILSEEHRNTLCETGELRGRACRVSWWRVLSESVEFLAWQHGGNIALDKDTRLQLTSGDFWGKYAYCVEHYRWWRYKDDDPFGVDYIGHPMMGSYSSFIYEQNDPKQRALLFSMTHQYWNGRLRAMAYSAAYSAQWKIGPASEASIGNTGITYYVRARDGVWTNETGMQDFFFTPIGGLVWNVAEDVVDRFFFRPILATHKNKLLLIGASIFMPTRSGANLFRFRAVYYRDHDDATAPEGTR